MILDMQTRRAYDAANADDDVIATRGWPSSRGELPQGRGGKPLRL